MPDTYRDGKVHVMAKKCDQCAFSPGRIIEPARVATIVRETTETLGGNFICHKTTMAGTGDAICRAWYDHLGSKDPILRLAQETGIIEEQEEPHD